jgi:hypothetical protein
LPFPDWRHPTTDDDRYLVSSWLEGRSGWAAFEPRRRSIVVAAPPRLVPDFDAEFLDAFTTGCSASWAEVTDRDSTLGELATRTPRSSATRRFPSGRRGWPSP